MLHPDKYIEVRLPLDVAYGVLGMVMNMLQGPALNAGCKAEPRDIPQLAAMYRKTASDILKMLDANDYCEHVKEAARDMRAAEKEGH